MLKEIKYLLFISIICFFIFFTTKYYFSDSHKKKSYRSLTNIDKKIEIYSQKLPTLDNDTQNIIEYVKNGYIKCAIPKVTAARIKWTTACLQTPLTAQYMGPINKTQSQDNLP